MIIHNIDCVLSMCYTDYYLSSKRTVNRSTSEPNGGEYLRIINILWYNNTIARSNKNAVYTENVHGRRRWHGMGTGIRCHRQPSRIA